jgi:hypothetical protein
MIMCCNKDSTMMMMMIKTQLLLVGIFILRINHNIIIQHVLEHLGVSLMICNDGHAASVRNEESEVCIR